MSLNGKTSQLVPLVPLSNKSYAADNSTAYQQVYREGRQESNPAVGKSRSRSRFNASDTISLAASLCCLGLALAAVLDDRLATWLEVTNQLIVLGFLLSIMSLLAFQRAQTLLLMAEARFGKSTLQNFDAIIRDEKFSHRTSLTIRIALLLLFALPLGLSASYKRYTGGRTSTKTQGDDQLVFGLSGPPGQLAASGRPFFVNATSAFYAGQQDIWRVDPPANTSYGYNMHVINETTTAMLDLPMHSNISKLQDRLGPGQSYTLSAPVHATFASLNSTPQSQERLDPDYWTNISDRLGGDGNTINRPIGGETWFWMYGSWSDNSLIYMGIYNTSLDESPLDTAIGFNIYRGTAQGSWQITRDSVVLLSANEFATNFVPGGYADASGPNEYCNISAPHDAMQSVIYCTWAHLPSDYSHVAPDYVLGSANSDGHYQPSPDSVWVVITAAMGWSATVAKYENFGETNPNLAFTLQRPIYELDISVPTLRREWGLFATLAAQPLLLVLILIFRLFLHPCSISDSFGLVALLAGVKRDTLSVLDGASYSGELRKNVIVDVMESEASQGMASDRYYPAVSYRLRVDDVKSTARGLARRGSRYQQVEG